MLRFERLEDRSCPAVVFHPEYDDTSGFFTPQVRHTFEAAIAEVGARLNPSGAIDMAVPVRARPLPTGQLGEAGPGYGITFSSTTWGWYFGESPLGLPKYGADFYTIAQHELGHFLGALTHLPDGTRFPFAGGEAAVNYPAMARTYPRGHRLQFSAADFAQLDAAGWDVAPAASTYALFSLRQADGSVRLWLITSAGAFDTGYRGREHVLVTDTFASIAPTGPGFVATWGINGNAASDLVATDGVPFYLITFTIR